MSVQRAVGHQVPPGKVPALLHVQTRTEPTFQYFYDGLDLDSAYLQKTGIVSRAVARLDRARGALLQAAARARR